MIAVRVVLQQGPTLGVFLFSQVPQRDEHVEIPQGVFRVMAVIHVGGDPADNNPPAWSAITVIPVA